MISEYGCFYCWDNKKKKDKKELYFLDAANNMRVCEYCPHCGRKYGEVPVDEQLESTDEQQQYDDRWY